MFNSYTEMDVWSQGPNVPMLSLRVARGPLCVSPIGPLPTLESFHTVLSRATFYKSFPLGRIYNYRAPLVKAWMVAHCICVIVNNLRRWEREGSPCCPPRRLATRWMTPTFSPLFPPAHNHIHPEYFQKRSTEFHCNRNARKQCFLMGPAATTVNWWIYEFTLAGGDYFHRAFHGLFSSGQNFGFWSSWSLFGVSE